MIISDWLSKHEKSGYQGLLECDEYDNGKIC